MMRASVVDSSAAMQVFIEWLLSKCWKQLLAVVGTVIYSYESNWENRPFHQCGTVMPEGEKLWGGGSSIK